MTSFLVKDYNDFMKVWNEGGTQEAAQNSAPASAGIITAASPAPASVTENPEEVEAREFWGEFKFDGDGNGDSMMFTLLCNCSCSTFSYTPLHPSSNKHMIRPFFF